jgi:hypothetical protein
MCAKPRRAWYRVVLEEAREELAVQLLGVHLEVQVQRVLCAGAGKSPPF